uniref:Transposase n=1 Tax=Brugia timori TaxID=42155 RepID=A0A0R3Q6P7_9BILA
LEIKSKVSTPDVKCAALLHNSAVRMQQRLINQISTHT